MKRIIFTILIFVSLINYTYSEDLTLFIGEDEYVRQMPSNVDELQVLVRELVTMYNDLNLDYSNLQNFSIESLRTIESQVSDSSVDITTIKNELSLFTNDFSNQITSLQEVVDNINTNPPRFGLSLGYGSSIPFGSSYLNLNGLVSITSTIYTNIGAMLHVSQEEIYPVINLSIGLWLF